MRLCPRTSCRSRASRLRSSVTASVAISSCADFNAWLARNSRPSDTMPTDTDSSVISSPASRGRASVASATQAVVRRRSSSQRSSSAGISSQLPEYSASNATDTTLSQASRSPSTIPYTTPGT
ncbi:hypothetical protein AB0I60_07700 [Actinosynnema sp. NPDC050436]|uniref:hypothetical protein n=1 Tax=Actinosynnema sp. NPDC050436 TaxID=3155659 RepID=UPI0033DDB2E0